MSVKKQSRLTCGSVKIQVPTSSFSVEATCVCVALDRTSTEAPRI